MSLKSSFGALISPLVVNFSFWVVKLDTGKLISERDSVHDQIKDGRRPIDWTLDLVTTGDIYHVKELWLICPPTPHSPLGNTARLPVTIEGGAFQFKVANLDSNFAVTQRTTVAQVIGRIDDPESGDCTCFIWDQEVGGLLTPWHTNYFRFASWREGIAPIQHLSTAVLGLDTHF